MAGEMKDEAINTLLDGIKKKVAEVKEEHKWKELFVSTGDFSLRIRITRQILRMIYTQFFLAII